MSNKFYNRDGRLRKDDVLDYDWNGDRHKHYGDNKLNTVFIVYILAILVWAAIAWYVQSNVGIFILFIPFVVFLIAICSLSGLSNSVEDSMFRTNFLATGMLITLPLLSCVISSFKGDRTIMIRVLLLAVTFTILSMIDVWVPEKYLSVTNHIRSIFQTLSLTLILYALYIFYDSMGDFPVLRTV